MKKDLYNGKYIVDLLTNLICYESTTDNQSAVEECLNYIINEIPTNNYDVKIIKNNGTS